MTSIQRIALVARREMRERIRSRAFLFSSAFTLLLLLGFVLVPSLVGDSGVDVKIGTLGEGNDGANDGERLLLQDPSGKPLVDMTYDSPVATSTRRRR